MIGARATLSARAALQAVLDAGSTPEEPWQVALGRRVGVMRNVGFRTVAWIVVGVALYAVAKWLWTR